MGTRRAVLVVAKAPVPGQVKTRLMSQYTARQAAELASASLVDTLDAALAVPAAQVVVSLAGDIGDAVGRTDLLARLDRTTVMEQFGDSLGERLHRAHRDTIALIGPGVVMQVGMDTPQVTPALLDDGLAALENADAALGHAADGGWWGLAVRGGRGTETLPSVPMSRDDTGERTETALRDAGLSVALLPPLSDMDRPDDVAGVVAACRPDSALARCLARWRTAATT